MLSVRLDEDLEQRLNSVCRRYGYSRSEVVKRSLAEEPPADPLRRRIWERLHEKYRSRCQVGDSIGSGSCHEVRLRLVEPDP